VCDGISKMRFRYRNLPPNARFLIVEGVCDPRGIIGTCLLLLPDARLCRQMTAGSFGTAAVVTPQAQAQNIISPADPFVRFRAKLTGCLCRGFAFCGRQPRGQFPAALTPQRRD